MASQTIRNLSTPRTIAITFICKIVEMLLAINELVVSSVVERLQCPVLRKLRA